MGRLICKAKILLSQTAKSYLKMYSFTYLCLSSLIQELEQS